MAKKPHKPVTMKEWIQLAWGAQLIVIMLLREEAKKDRPHLHVIADWLEAIRDQKPEQ